MFFSVDYSKCNQDALCALECPAKIIEMDDKGPMVIEGTEDTCIQCGHCVAICPEAALTLDNWYNPSDAAVMGIIDQIDKVER